MTDHVSSPAPRWAEYALPLIIAAAILLIAISFYAPRLSTGMLTDYDEYHTLDRSLSVITHGEPWTIYSVNEPSFRKPPLQYWVTAALMQAGLPELVALRAFSFLSALGTLVLTGFLALRLVPKSPATAVAAMTLLAASPMFWDLATSALLDSGAAFFATAAGLFLLIALEKPRALWLVALAVGLGSLQKSPASAVIVAAMLLTLRFTRRESLGLLFSSENRPLRRRALGLALAMIFGWTVLQTILHGVPAISESIVQEMLGRFAPGAPSAAAENGANWVGWLWADAPLLWGPAVLAALALPLTIGTPAATAIVGWLGLFFIAMTLAGGNIFPRYLMLAMPFLAASLAAVLARFLRQPLFALAAAIALAGLTPGTFQPIELRVSPMMPFLPIMARFQAAIEPGDTLIVCNWSRQGKHPYPGALSLYASGGKPFTSLKRDPAKSLARDLGQSRPPYRGLCSERDLETLKAAFPDLTVRDRDAGMLHWTATKANL